MIIVSKRKAVILLLFIFLASISVAVFHMDEKPVFSQKATKCIVIDAGHGFPDGGAIGMNGTIESTLNLKIALNVEKLLQDRGYRVIMTRRNDDSLSDSGKNVSEKKRNDMKKRLEIINSSEADIFVSIHMNKYGDSRYRGAQVIYSSNYVQSEALASAIQKELCSLSENKSKRTHLEAPKSIYLLKNACIPAVIAECGFLSNFEEEQLLITEDYQKKIAKAIVLGIENYYKKEYSE